jgi:hypothetical protein
MRRYARYVTRLLAVAVMLVSVTFIIAKIHTILDNVRRPSSQQAWTKAMISHALATRAEQEGRHQDALMLLRTAQQQALAIVNVEKKIQALASIGRLQFEYRDGRAARESFEAARQALASVGISDSGSYSRTIAMEIAQAGEVQYLQEFLGSELAPSPQYHRMVLVALARARHVHKAMAIAQAFPLDSGTHGSYRSETLEGLAAIQADEQGDLEAARLTLELIPKERRLQYQLSKLFFLAASAAERTRRGEQETVQQDLDAMVADLQKKQMHGYAQAQGWASVARAYLGLGKQAEAHRAIEQAIESYGAGYDKVEFLKEIHPLYLAMGLQNEAHRSVLSLKEPLFQIRGLVHLARLRATRGDKEAAGQLLDEAEGLASRLLRDNWQAWSLAEIAAALQEIGQDRRAEEVARSVHGESERVSLFDVFSLAFVLSGGLAGWALFHYKEPGRLVTQAMAAGTAVVLALQLAFLIVSTPALAPRTDLQMNLLCLIEIWLVFTVIVLRTPSIKGTMVPAVPASR